MSCNRKNCLELRGGVCGGKSAKKSIGEKEDLKLSAPNREAQKEGNQTIESKTALIAAESLEEIHNKDLAKLDELQAKAITLLESSSPDDCIKGEKLAEEANKLFKALYQVGMSSDQDFLARKLGKLKYLERSYHNLRNTPYSGIRSIDDRNDENAKRLKTRINQIKSQLKNDGSQES
jgi:hypothetical protein